MRTLLSIFLSLFTCLILFGQEKEIVPNQASMRQQSWLNAFNQRTIDTAQYKTPGAISVAENGIFYIGMPAIQKRHEELKAQSGPLDSLYTLFSTTAGRENEYRYEIGALTSKNGKELTYLSVSNLSTPFPTRELEFISPVSLAKPDLSEIEEARNRWMELCNAHDAYKLVKQCYTANALYYNHKPLIFGTDSIAKVYSYMNRESYRLTLVPLHVELVSVNLVFEIGQCSGSYGGKYVIIWKREDDGIWRVLLDSNV